MVTKSSIIALTVALGVVAASGLPSTARSSGRLVVAGAWLKTPARTLAALDCGCAPSAARVARYTAVLNRLATRCQESRGRLGYISKTATVILRQAGHRRTNLWLLREVDAKTPTRVSTQQPCRYVFALVVSSI